MTAAIRDRMFGLLLFLFCLYFPGSQLHAQQNGLFYVFWPYDASNFGLDFTRIAYGSTPEEVCAQRNEFELTLNGGLSGSDHLIFLGSLSSGGNCGFRWINPQGGSVITQSDFFPTFASCQEINTFDSRIPRPTTPQCISNVPPKEGGCGCCESDGSGGGGGGGGDGGSFCGNPINAGTGNKFQLETDLSPVGTNSVRFVRYYNSEHAAYDGTLGGMWQHTYTRAILINGAATDLIYYRNDAKQLAFHSQGGVWTSDADIADRLVELTNSNSLRIGWQLRVAKTEDIEGYDASGRLISITARNGLRQTLTYTDGTNGTTSGNGGFVLDASGSPTTTPLPKGILLRVVDNFGRTLTFGYDSLFRIVKVTDPAGGVFLYAYSASTRYANLTSVTYQSSS